MLGRDAISVLPKLEEHFMHINGFSAFTNATEFFEHLLKQRPGKIVQMLSEDL